MATDSSLARDEIGHPRMPVFVSYAHEDNEGNGRWLDRLLQMLKPLELNDQVCAWSDRRIAVGQQWKQEIDFQLSNAAKAAVLLVSPAYLASDFIRSGELPVLLKRHQDDGLPVIPIILSSCLFEAATFRYPDPITGPETLSLAVFQAVNPPNQPLDSMPTFQQHEILAQVGRTLLNLFQASRRG